MGEPKTAAPIDGQRYRELAEKLRKIARQSRSPGAQQKILNFASRWDGIADHADKRRSGSSQDLC